MLQTNLLLIAKKKDASFSKLRRSNVKKKLKERLLEDQGYICCYCGARIENDKHTVIDHIKCQDRHKNLSLSFDNMLVSCDGGQEDRKNNKVPEHQLHCDAKKNNKDIPFSPLDEEIENLFIYFEDGSIKSKKHQADDMMEILGLDAEYLKSQRKNAIEGCSENCLNEAGDCTQEKLAVELEKVKNKHDGKFEPYCFVQEQYLTALVLANKESKRV